MTVFIDQLSTLRQQDLAERWDASVGQVAQSMEAIRSGRLEIANTGGDIAERRNRLGLRGLLLEGIVETDDSVWLSFLESGLRAARAVGRVVRLPRRQPIYPVGTGVLIAPGLMLTNNHVIETPDDAAEMGIQFGYDYAADGSELPYDTVALMPERFFATDADLDFTVVAVVDLGGMPPGERHGTVPLIEQPGKAVKAEALNVIHHPGGGRKKLSIRQNRMVAEDEMWLRYTSDTREGSSGAPVFNDQWEMVALHHGGVPARDARGLSLDRAGQVWSAEAGEDAKAYMANEGARVSRIVRRLRETPLEPAARNLIDQALQAGATS